MNLKFLVMLTTAAVTIGCTGEGHVEKPEGEQTKIVFSTLLSRGTAISSAAQLAAAGGFDVWAYSHSGTWDSNPTEKNALFAGVAVTSNDGNTWSYASPVEWPDNNVSFFAYAPSGKATVTPDPSSKVPQLSYSVATAVADQQDLLFAEDLYNKQGHDYYPVNKKVELLFKHALSRISFSACYTGSATGEVKITRVALKHVYDEGTAPLTIPVVWVTGSRTADYSLLLTNNELNDIALNATPADILPENRMFFLMPQEVNRSNDIISLEVSFTVNNSEISHNTLILSPTAWQPGQPYKYQIDIDDNSIRAILIDNDIDLERWNESIALQTITLTSDKAYDRSHILFALSALNEINVAERRWYGVYGVNDISHDITINLDNDLSLNKFETGQRLLFDFKKMIRIWGEDDVRNSPWKVKVEYDTLMWKLAPAIQGLAPDATTGASLPVETVSNEITARGSIIFEKL